LAESGPIKELLGSSVKTEFAFIALDVFVIRKRGLEQDNECRKLAPVDNTLASTVKIANHVLERVLIESPPDLRETSIVPEGL